MRSAAEAIARSRFRSSLIVVSEATRDAGALAAAATSTPAGTSPSGHAAWIPHLPPSRNTSSSSSLDTVTWPAYGTSRSHSVRRHNAAADNSCHAAAHRQLAATAPPAGLSHSGLAPSPSPGSFRGFAASAAGGRRSGGHEAVEEVVAADEAARMVLGDPMSRLMASQGMPIGLSLRDGAGTGAAAAGPGGRGGRGGDSEEEGEPEDLSRPPLAEPAYQMEAFSDMLRATAAAAAARRGGGGGGGGVDGDPRVGGFTAGVQQVGPSLEDSWGTTRESPADIARRIVESNMAAEGGPVGFGVGGALSSPSPEGDDESPDDDESPLSLSPSEEKYASLEAMSADIKKLDEVFEVLASVPWLDEDVLAEKELRGVAQVGLLGTLEEVGFNIRHQLLRIWSGERGADLAAGPGLEFRDQAALLAILYHTQQIEEQHGAPPRGYLAKPPALQGEGQ
ncbi:hypothetical protein PLESTB_000779500 [Pleodorina starrii]|uniref:Uncharacterized protein n=1 Tax=Pleodorina starrii TaxID=330485 RepID=A0A9W6F2T0_9CHLO|nr:hypothetical protein PLESTM_000505200 [Pleodorina starrii]GLC53715.1 hypothetical protein PLESTB_000779500 [Pleodorina starrii]GLC72899.1 hypothetical protein PLESTF_001307500 [Pleodorina starrii]